MVGAGHALPPNFRFDTDREPNRIRDETMPMRLDVQIASPHRIATCDGHDRMQAGRDEFPRAVLCLAQCAGGGVLVTDHNDLGRGTQVQIPQHVTSGQARYQQFFGTVAGGIAPVGGCTGALDRGFAIGGDDVVPAIAPVRSRARPIVASPCCVRTELVLGGGHCGELGCPSIRDGLRPGCVINYENQRALMVAVLNLDVHAGFRHAARELAQLAGLSLIQSLQHDVIFRKDAETGCFERLPGGGPVCKQKVAYSLSVYRERTPAFEAHFRASQRLAHLRQLSRLVPQLDSQILHENLLLTRTSDPDGQNLIVEDTIWLVTQEQFGHYQTMAAEPDLGRLARVIGDPTRIRMLTLLMEGRALTAKELAYGTGVEPATGTTHLHRLLDDHLIVNRTQGRHKYFRLASPHVARCVESLMTIAQPRKTTDSDSLSPMRLARFCYDHLAGRVAVQMARFFLARGLVRTSSDEFTISRRGMSWFRDFGIDTEKVARTRRRFAYPCLDWTERQDHIGGALGAALAQAMVTKGWLTHPTDTRVAKVTRIGTRELREVLMSRWHEVIQSCTRKDIRDMCS